MNTPAAEALAQAARRLLEAGPEAAPPGALLSARADRFVVRLEGAVVKVYLRRPGLLERLGALLVGDRAQRAARTTRRARDAGLPVPEVLAMVRGPAGAALVLREVEGARELRAAYFEAPPGRARQELAREAAALVARLHRARFFSGDLHQGNVLVDRAGRLALIDADGLRRLLFVSRRRQVRNLERLLRDFLGAHQLNRSARLRFLGSYTSDRAEARRLWRLVAQRLAVKRRQYGLPPP